MAGGRLARSLAPGALAPLRPRRRPSPPEAVGLAPGCTRAPRRS
jgi:hypothetical protein